MNSNSRTTNADQATIPILDDAPELTEHEDQTRGDHTNFAPPQAMSTHVIDQFPFGCLGMPMPNKSKGSSMYETWRATSKDTPWTPFCSELDWNVAQWVKMRGPSSTAAMELLAIPGVCVSHQLYTMCLIQVRKVVDMLGLSFHTVKELNDKIDSNLSGRPDFQCKILTINREDLEFYSRDVIESIRSLYGDP